MKYTLLQLVQSIASSMDSDEINSISDSVESLQIAAVVRTAYYDLIARADLPEHKTLVTLDASNDSTKPTLMTLPSTVSDVDWVRYNKILAVGDQTNMEVLQKLPLETFLDRNRMLDTTQTNVGSFTQTIGSDTFTFYYYNDRQPSYYTTFDDRTILFDSYDATIETTLQKSNSECYGRKVITFTMSDTFTPDLDENQFPILLNEAKSLAWFELKQSAHNIAERNTRRGWARLQKNKNNINLQSDFDKLPYYGRK